MENKEKIRSLAENVWAYIAAFLRWGVLGLLVGGLGGFVGALFFACRVCRFDAVSYKYGYKKR